MSPLGPGTIAPPIPGVSFGEPTALFFYKVTCPVCQMAAPKVAGFERAYPGAIVGVGEDPPAKLERFDQEFGLGFASVPDLEPYDASNAYGLVSVPTLFVVGADGAIVSTVESWDRDAYNEASRVLAGLLRRPYAEISNAADGLPAFRPG